MVASIMVIQKIASGKARGRCSGQIVRENQSTQVAGKLVNAMATEKWYMKEASNTRVPSRLTKGMAMESWNGPQGQNT